MQMKKGYDDYSKKKKCGYGREANLFMRQVSNLGVKSQKWVS